MYRYVCEVDVHVYTYDIYLYIYRIVWNDKNLKKTYTHSYCNYILSMFHILADLSTSKHQTSESCNLAYQHWPFCKAQLKTSGLHCRHGSLKFALQMQRSKLRCKSEKKSDDCNNEANTVILHCFCMSQVNPSSSCNRHAWILKNGKSDEPWQLICRTACVLISTSFGTFASAQITSPV